MEIHFEHSYRTYRAMTAPHNLSVIINCLEFYLAMAAIVFTGYSE